MVYSSLVAFHFWAGLGMIVLLIAWGVWCYSGLREEISGITERPDTLSTDRAIAERGGQYSAQMNGFIFGFSVIIIILLATGIYLFFYTNPKVIMSSEALSRWRTGYYSLWHWVLPVVGTCFIGLLIFRQENFRRKMWWLFITLIFFLFCFLPCWPAFV